MNAETCEKLCQRLDGWNEKGMVCAGLGAQVKGLITICFDLSVKIVILSRIPAAATLAGLLAVQLSFQV
jgi:hypothetical protein